MLHKKDWKKVTAHVATRISAQVRSHAQKVLPDYSSSTSRTKRHKTSGCEFREDNSQAENLCQTETPDVSRHAEEMSMSFNRGSINNASEVLPPEESHAETANRS